MISTFVNLPEAVDNAISTILTQQTSKEWIKRTELLHERYMSQDSRNGYIHDYIDVLAYLGMRVPATYAQIYSALAQVQEVAPSWQPKTILDIGSGPGTGIWAAQELWPTIKNATCIDMEKNMIYMGQQITESTQLPITISWKEQNLKRGIIGNNGYDIVLLGNILNELSKEDREKVLNSAYDRCKGILIIVEPGTPHGSSIVEEAAKHFATYGTLLSPYINNSFIQKNDFWLHFPQRFNRPEFQRRVRQNMRDSILMASDVEEAKFSYVAISKIPTHPVAVWGRCVGQIKKLKGFLEVPVMTEKEIITLKVMQRHKKEYNFAKELKWGQIIEKEEDLVVKQV